MAKGTAASYPADRVTRSPTPENSGKREELAFFCRKEEFCFEDQKPLALTKCLMSR